MNTRIERWRCAVAPFTNVPLLLIGYLAHLVMGRKL